MIRAKLHSSPCRDKVRFVQLLIRMVQLCCSCPSLQVQLTTLIAGTTNIATLTVLVVGMCYQAPIGFLHLRSAYPDAGCYFSLTESNSVPQEMNFAPLGMTFVLLEMTSALLEMTSASLGMTFAPLEMTSALLEMTSALLEMTFVLLEMTSALREMLCSDVGGQFGGHGDDAPWRRDDSCRLVSDGTDARLVRCGLTCLTMRVGHDHHGDAVLVLRLEQCHYAIFGLGWRGNGDKNCQEKLPLFSCRFVINFHNWECLQRRCTSGCLHPVCSSSGRARCSPPDSRL